MRRTLLAASALALALAPAASAEDIPATCGGVTAVSRTCTFSYSGSGELFFHVQNIRVVRPGIVSDDSVSIEVFNVTQNRRLDGCTAVAIAAGCGQLRAETGTVAGDVIQCTALGQGSIVVTAFNCS